MIELVTGSPGSGKSYFAVRRILEGLRSGRRVVTNIELNLDAVGAWLRARGIGSDQLEKQLLIVDGDPAVLREFWKLGRAGTIYVLDEVSYIFDARMFQEANDEFRRRKAGGETRLDAIWSEAREGIMKYSGIRYRIQTIASGEKILDVTQYLRTHRHLGDDVVFVCQRAEDLLASARRIVNQVWWMVNSLDRSMAKRGPLASLPWPVEFFIGERRSPRVDAAKVAAVEETIYLPLRREIYSCYNSYQQIYVGEVSDVRGIGEKRKAIARRRFFVRGSALLALGMVIVIGVAAVVSPLLGGVGSKEKDAVVSAEATPTPRPFVLVGDRRIEL